MMLTFSYCSCSQVLASQGSLEVFGLTASFTKEELKNAYIDRVKQVLDFIFVLVFSSYPELISVLFLTALKFIYSHLRDRIYY